MRFHASIGAWALLASNAASKNTLSTSSTVGSAVRTHFPAFTAPSILPQATTCVSNCSIGIVSDETPPAKFYHIGYFEGWSMERPCMKWDISSVKSSQYTHIHFAFARITNDFQVDVTGVQDQFDKFVEVRYTIRILSFGGWSFSTPQDSSPIFGQSVTKENRETFAHNVVDFLKEHDLNGVDFVWDVSSGDPIDGQNYLHFLELVRALLRPEKSLSVAVPVSSWHPQSFPIKAISNVVDYIVFGTYDLHGQWDYNKPGASAGCPSGNCLRSHVNGSEIMSALSLIKNAGVSTAKIIPSIARYGRSFEMSDAGCRGPMCTFKGPQFGAQPGVCTNTAGYLSNAEIDLIMEMGGAEVHYDAVSESSIMVYDDTQWVAYMNESTTLFWILLYEASHFGGVSEWAIDLASVASPSSISIRPCDATFDSLDDLAAAADVPMYCMNGYIIAVLSNILNKAMKGFDDIMHAGYDEKFNTYSGYVKTLIPQQIESFMKDKANRYFTCKIQVYNICCKDCSSAWSCRDGCKKDPCTSGWTWEIKTCPSDIPSDIALDPAKDLWRFTCNKPDAFFADLKSQYNIDKSWIEFGQLLAYVDRGCHSDDPASDCFHYWTGFPVAVKDFTVHDPKDGVAMSLKNFTAVEKLLSDATINVNSFLTGDDSTSDIVDATALPALMAQEAVKAMASVVKKAKDIEEAEEKQMIFMFVTSVLMLAPGAGAGAEAIGLASLGRSITLIGEVGDAATAIYGVVEDPKSAVFALFGALLAGSGNRQAFSTAAGVRRGMSGKDIAALGPKVEASLNRVREKMISCI